MVLNLSGGEIAYYFKGVPMEGVPVGVLLAGGLVVAFVILAGIVSVYQFQQMRNRMQMLDADTRTRKAQDEELSNFGSSKMAPRKQMRDPWEK